MWWTFSSFETIATKKDSDIGKKYRNRKENKVMLIVKRSNPSSKTFAVLLLTAPKHNSYLNPPQFCSEQKDETNLVTSNKPKRAIII